MTERSSAFRVVDEQWKEEQKRTLTYREYLELFYTRMERLDDAKSSIEKQSTQNMEARMHLRREALEQAAQAGANEELIRTFLPDMSDPIIKLIDASIDFLYQLRLVAEQRPAIDPESQAVMADLVNALSLPPALIRSAMIGIVWPIDDKMDTLSDLSLQRDFDISKNTTPVEDGSDEDEDPNNNPA